MQADFEKYNEIIEAMQAAPDLQPPADFTHTVMSRLPGRTHNLSQLLGLTGSDSNRVCFYYFSLAGFFYLVMGIVVLGGLEEVRYEAPLAAWLNLQPLLAFTIAAILFITGASLLKKKMTIIAIARLGVSLYIGAVILNGFIIHSAVTMPAATALLLVFNGVGLLAGIFLALVVRIYGQNFQAGGRSYL